MSIKIDNIDNQLIEATEDGDINKVKKLIKEGANVNSIDSLKNTPIYYAVVNGYFDIAALLLKSKAEINGLYKDKKNLLHVAVEIHGNLYHETDMIELLIKNKIFVNQKDKYGNTPLWYACISYVINKDVIKILLENGADMNLINNYGTSVYKSAEDNQREELLEILRMRNNS